MWITIFIMLFVAWIIYASIQNAEFNAKEKARKEAREVERRKQEEIQKQKFETEYQTLLDKFGTCTAEIKLRWTDLFFIDSRLFVFEESQMIVLYGNEYRFSDILNFSLVDDATSETITTSTGDAKTSTGSILGRAVVGGMLTGGLGAVAGAATAKKNIATSATSKTTTTHKYTMYINVNSLTNPTITIPLGRNSQKAYKLANLFNVIIAKGQG